MQHGGRPGRARHRQRPLSAAPGGRAHHLRRLRAAGPAQHSASRRRSRAGARSAPGRAAARAGRRRAPARCRCRVWRPRLPCSRTSLPGSQSRAWRRGCPSRGAHTRACRRSGPPLPPATGMAERRAVRGAARAGSRHQDGAAERTLAHSSASAASTAAAMCASAACIGGDCRGGVRALGARLRWVHQSAACLPCNEARGCLQVLY